MDTPSLPLDKWLPLADSLAYVSRHISRGYGRKLAEILFRYYPAKTGTTVIHDFDGDLSMALDRGSYISSAIYWSGHHGLSVIRFLQGFLKPEMTFADVGREHRRGDPVCGETALDRKSAFF